MRALARAIDGLELPAVEKISESQEEDPFQVLIATLLSARTQDATTLAASTRLFKVARTPRDDGAADGQADRAADLSGQLLPAQGAARESRPAASSIERFGGRVPATMEELLTLPGVGRKTANLVLILAFKSQREHLRRHARAPHLEPARLGDDARRRRRPSRRSTGSRRRALVAVHQSVPRDLGPERLPARLSALRGLRAGAGLSAAWGHPTRKAWRQAESVCGHRPAVWRRCSRPAPRRPRAPAR